MASKPSQMRPMPHHQPARPLHGREARLGFVASDDRGCNGRGLFPDTPLLVQPCEEFVGVGIYQLYRHGKLEVRRCRQIDAESIEITVDGPPSAGGGRFTVSVEIFEEHVCGLVLAEIQGINEEWTARLYEQRIRFYS